MAGIEEIYARDLMTRELITAGAEDTVSDAISEMKKHDISEILVVDDKAKIIGIVSDDAFVRRGHLPLSTKLEHTMLKPPTVKEDETIIDVCEMLLSSGQRGITVESNKGEIIGFISRTDVVNAIPNIDDLKNIKVKNIMTPSPTTINEDESIGKAKNLMRKLDERVLPVVDDYGKLTGMIGLVDIIKETFKPPEREERGDRSGEKDSPTKNIMIKSIMVEPPITTSNDVSIYDAAKKMTKNSISTLVSIDDGEVKGIVTQIDLIETIASFRESDQVYVQITGLEEGPDTFNQMYEVVQKYLQKIHKVVKPLVLNIHVVTHQKEGSENKYSIRLRLQTDHGMFYMKEHGWNLFKSLDEGLQNMRRKIFKEKEKEIDLHRKHPKYRR